MARKKTSQTEIPKEQKVVPESFEEQMSKSYIDYAMSVITSRALPDVRDGLKPVQRRVLYDMDLLGVDYDKPHRKSARIVGDTMGKFHAHGDSSIYGALVHMSQDWLYSTPLVDKHGNMGSIEGDGAAAMRYCVTGDTLINTNNGLVRIDEIIPNTKKNSDNKIDIRVKSMGGKLNWANTLFNSSYQKVFQIYLKNGMEIRVSDNHPLLIMNKDKKLVWVLAKDLKPGMKCIVDTCADNAMFGKNNDLVQAEEHAKYVKRGFRSTTIPQDVFNGSKEYLIVFLKKLFGEKTKIFHQSEKCLKELQIILATQFGYYSKIHYAPKSENYILEVKDNKSKYRAVTLKSIYCCRQKELVYSIRVNSACHSFTGNGFINHNTEARLSKISQNVLLDDLNKNTVEFVPNYDDTEVEPSVLPAKIPNLLVSGSEGIAVGMACSIPTHNLAEVLEAAKLMLSKKNVTTEELLEVIKGPDFATGGIISNKKDLLEMYKTGKGKIRIRGKAEIIEKNGKPYIQITEIPITMVGAIDKFISSIGDLMRERKAPDIVNVENLSGKEGIQINIELKKGANAQKNLNLLYKKAKLEDTFSFNMLAIKDNEPKVFSLIEYFQEFISFQMEIYTRKYQTLLEKQLKEKEIKEGLVKAIDCIDLIIEILRGSKKKADAFNCLTKGDITNISFKTKKSESLAKKLNFTDAQTNAILSMPLQSLIGLEIEALMKDLQKCNKLIEEYNGYLSSPTKMRNKIKSELDSISKEFSIPRRTVVTDEKEVVLEKEELVEQTYYLLIDRFRYSKLIDDSTYQRNLESIPKDYKYCLQIKNTDKLYIFSDSGKCHQVKVSLIPLCKYKDKGTPLENLSNLLSSENIVFLDAGEKVISQKLIFVNTKGYIKIVPGTEFISTTKTIAATKLADDAKVLFINYNTDDEIILSTSDGYFIRFKTEEISEMKKTSNGVRGIKLKDNDSIKNCFIGNSKSSFCIDETEYPFTRIKLSKRDGTGTKCKL